MGYPIRYAYQDAPPPQRRFTRPSWAFPTGDGGHGVLGHGTKRSVTFTDRSAAARAQPTTGGFLGELQALGQREGCVR